MFSFKFLSPAATSQSSKPLLLATGQDHQEWLQHRLKQKSAFYNLGDSPKDDFERWLRARGKTQYPAPTPISTPPEAAEPASAAPATA